MVKRDQKILEFINRVGKCTIEQLAKYIGVSNVRAYQIINRIKKEDLIKHERIFHNKLGIIYCTSKGAKFTGIDKIRDINISSLNHDLISNDILIEHLLTSTITEFVTERELRQNKEIDHYPDLILTDINNGKIAIEIELTRKSLQRIENIKKYYLTELSIDKVIYYVNDDLISFIQRVYSEIDMVEIINLNNHD